MYKYFQTSEATAIRDCGAVGAETILKTRENQKILTSMGNFKMKKRINISILLVMICIAMTINSCKPLYLATLEPKTKNERLLPSLNPILDEKSFASIFGESRSSGTGRGVGYRNSYMGNWSTTTGRWNVTTYPNPRINEINVIFQRDMANICELYGDTQGSIKCSAVVGNNKLNQGVGVPSALLLCIPNLFGAPLFCWKTQLQIEVSVYDNNNKLIGRYISDFYKQKTYVALYWGYSLGNSEPKSVRAVFTECMEDIKNQIAKDYDNLNAALK
jgi:hypothetical protein